MPFLPEREAETEWEAKAQNARQQNDGRMASIGCDSSGSPIRQCASTVVLQDPGPGRILLQAQATFKETGGRGKRSRVREMVWTALQNRGRGVPVTGSIYLSAGSCPIIAIPTNPWAPAVDGLHLIDTN